MQRCATNSRLRCLAGAGLRPSSTNTINVILPSSWRPLIYPRNLNEVSASTNCFLVRKFATKSKHNKMPNRVAQNATINPTVAKLKQNTFQQAILKHRNRIKFFLKSFTVFMSLNLLAAYTHAYDDLFFYFYPFPFALDVGHGPSMMPTMHFGGEMFWRDCWSHRIVWLNLDHLKHCFNQLFSEQSTTQEKVSLRRPWQNGDVVTVFNPFTRSIVTKRIIGVGGDSIRLFGEFAQKYHAAMDAHGAKNEWNSCGVPHDTRLQVPYCQKVFLEREKMANITGRHSNSEHESMMIVPPGYVWLEGDNPPFSTDSRHYGPIPVSALRGRDILRLWPTTRPGYPSDQQIAFLDSKRPDPFMNTEWMKDHGIREKR